MHSKIGKKATFEQERGVRATWSANLGKNKDKYINK